jgi:hypothetical protein
VLLKVTQKRKERRKKFMAKMGYVVVVVEENSAESAITIGEKKADYA